MSRQIKDELQDKIEAKDIHILTKRTAAGGGLLIFVNSNEDREHKNKQGLVPNPRETI